MPEDPDLARQAEHARSLHLLVDKRPVREIGDRILAPMHKFGRLFWLSFLVLTSGLVAWGVAWSWQMYEGMGVTGLNRPVMWAPYIANFVYFIGIGHAGTFISAALRVMHTEWRAPVSRAAELLTVFALSSAFAMPLVHLGRTWKFYYLVPYPNDRQLWPSFHSALLWDATAIFTYLTCSILFVYLGLMPDLATARDRNPTGWRGRLYAAAALGWRGTERQWATHETAMNIFSYAIIPVMFSVHTIVSWDFAMALQPTWHSTIFGPYFIAGALFSGAAAVILVLAMVRKFMHLEYFLRAEHFNGMGKFLLVLSFTWAYFYFNEYLVTWYGQLPVEKRIYAAFQAGWASPWFWLMFFGNIVVPWIGLSTYRLRTSIPVIVIVSIFVQIGMYIERVLIVGGALGYNELPFSWGRYSPRLPEVLIIIGTFALVGFGYWVYTRLFPIIPIWEVEEGQKLYALKRFGRAIIRTRTEGE